jgi:hypothetical protein
MKNLDFVARLFIFIGWLFIIFKAGPELWKDIKEMYREIKRPAAGTADQEKTSNYNISEFQNIHNLERWR